MSNDENQKKYDAAMAEILPSGEELVASVTFVVTKVGCLTWVSGAPIAAYGGLAYGFEKFKRALFLSEEKYQINWSVDTEENE